MGSPEGGREGDGSDCVHPAERIKGGEGGSAKGAKGVEGSRGGMARSGEVSWGGRGGDRRPRATNSWGQVHGGMRRGDRGGERKGGGGRRE